jgi:hypothetical protein
MVLALCSSTDHEADTPRRQDNDRVAGANLEGGQTARSRRWPGYALDRDQVAGAVSREAGGEENTMNRPTIPSEALSQHQAVPRKSLFTTETI